MAIFVSEKDGIAHFYGLPQNEVYIELKPDFKTMILPAIKLHYRTYAKAAKTLNIPRYEFQIFANGHSRPLSFILKLVQLLYPKDPTFSLKTFEQNIKSLSSKAGHKILDPKLPFNFNTKEGVRIIASVLHDGSLTKTFHFDYTNIKRTLITRLKKAVKFVIGDIAPNENVIPNNSINPLICIRYPNIVGYILYTLGIKPGDKVTNDINVPEFIFKLPENLISEFLGQSIAEDGSFHFNMKNRARSMSIAYAKDIAGLDEERKRKIESFESVPKIIHDITKLFETLGIEINGPYFMKENLSKRSGKLRYTHSWFVSIDNKENLEKLYKKVKIPLKYKQDKLREIINSYKILGNGELEKLVLEKIANGQLTSPIISDALKRDRETIREVILRLESKGKIKLKEKGSGPKPNIYRINNQY